LIKGVKPFESKAFTEIPADLLTAPPGVYREVPFHSQKVTMGPHRRWFERTLNRVTQAQRLRRAAIDPAVVAASRIAVRADGKTLFEMAPDGTIKKAESSERELAMFIPMGIMSLMYLAIMMSQYMLQSTMEEKQQRIAEVLLGSLSPFQLMAGKLLANVGVSLTVVAVYMIGGTFTASNYSVTQHVPFGILGWFFVYQVLAVLLFGSIFASVGAAASDLKDAQGYMMPVMITFSRRVERRA
jgi:ABC-type Na+ efflux pump permease subunit